MAASFSSVSVTPSHASKRDNGARTNAGPVQLTCANACSRVTPTARGSTSSYVPGAGKTMPTESWSELFSRRKSDWAKGFEREDVEAVHAASTHREEAAGGGRRERRADSVVERTMVESFFWNELWGGLG